jgi:hypothetical protein
MALVGTLAFYRRHLICDGSKEEMLFFKEGGGSSQFDDMAALVALAP